MPFFPALCRRFSLKIVMSSLVFHVVRAPNSIHFFSFFVHVCSVMFRTTYFPPISTLVLIFFLCCWQTFLTIVLLLLNYFIQKIFFY